MTIITSKNTVEEKKEGEKKLTADVEASSSPVPLTEASWNNQPPLEWYLAWRRRRLLTSLCATLLILWLLMAAIVGSILLFRYLHRRPVFYGWCGTDYVEQDSAISAKLQQRVEVDQDKEYEKIDVPRFGPNRPATFVHDFRQNWTAIVDLIGGQCFLKPLDRRQIAPPSNFIDLVRKMESGYYEQNTAVIRERYRVRLPPLNVNELEDLGSWMITQQCSHFTTFMLEKSFHALERPRRSTKSKCHEYSYAYYNAHGAVIKESIETCV